VSICGKPLSRSAIVLAIAALPTATQAQQGTTSLQTKGPPPVTSFVVNYDCAKLRISATSVGKPGSVSTFTPKFRRYTRQCTPVGGAAANQWCTQEVWRVTADYSWTSDLEPGKVNQEKDVDSGEVACDCHCVQVVGRICVSGKNIASSGLQGTSGNYHTDYTVEFEATKDGAPPQTWTQGVRVDGPRSWYGYTYHRCFDSNDRADFCAKLGADRIVAPGCGAASAPSS
jgi:hypothetical protein